MKTLILTLITGAAVSTLLVAQPVSATNHNNQDHKIGICHATGSKTNPYVYINVDKHAAAAHAKHQDGRDIIGVASAKDCVKPVASVPTTAPTVTPSGEVLGASTTQAQPQPATLPETGAGLGALIGLPAMLVATREYLRSRRS